MYGLEYIQNSFRLQIMRELKAPKFCEKRVQTLEIQNIEAKSGFRCLEFSSMLVRKAQ